MSNMNWIKKHLIPIGLGVALVLAAALLAWQSYDTNQRAQQQADSVAVEEADEPTPNANQEDEEEPAEKPKAQEPAPVAEPVVTTGVIEGSLTYPSEGIPSGLKVCAKNTVSNAVTCTTKHLNNKKYIYDKGYRLTVKAGKYKVYAVNPSDGQPAYYNKYMKSLATTGEWGEYPANCATLTPLVLNVVAGESYFDIAVGDWYYDGQCN